MQELLAPQNVVFYDRHWVDGGTKLSLAGTISSITRIDTALLSGDTSINHYSVAQRLSWAAYREVTRVENTAYALLGLFDINMPLLYGEGLRAFDRLQLAIIESSTDHTIFAWQVDPDIVSTPTTRRVLATTPRDFKTSGAIVQTIKRL